MFTGLVEECGEVLAIERGERTAKLTVKTDRVYEGAQLGDSVAVNGCCLTVMEMAGSALTFEAVPETLARTNLGGLEAGSFVNLERPLTANARLGGHFVQGHIDGVGEVLAVTPDENAVVLKIGIPPALQRYFVEKGSIAVDGVSLTVAGVEPGSFTVWTIPHTREVTTLGRIFVGDRVNLECDILGKYIEQLVKDRIVS